LVSKQIDTTEPHSLLEKCAEKLNKTKVVKMWAWEKSSEEQKYLEIIERAKENGDWIYVNCLDDEA